MYTSYNTDKTSIDEAFEHALTVACQKNKPILFAKNLGRHKFHTSTISDLLTLFRKLKPKTILSIPLNHSRFLIEKIVTPLLYTASSFRKNASVYFNDKCFAELETFCRENKCWNLHQSLLSCLNRDILFPLIYESIVEKAVFKIKIHELLFSFSDSYSNKDVRRLLQPILCQICRKNSEHFYSFIEEHYSKLSIHIATCFYSVIKMQEKSSKKEKSKNLLQEYLKIKSKTALDESYKNRTHDKTMQIIVDLQDMVYEFTPPKLDDYVTRIIIKNLFIHCHTEPIFQRYITLLSNLDFYSSLYFLKKIGTRLEKITTISSQQSGAISSQQEKLARHLTILCKILASKINKKNMIFEMDILFLYNDDVIPNLFTSFTTLWDILEYDSINAFCGIEKQNKKSLYPIFKKLNSNLITAISFSIKDCEVFAKNLFDLLQKRGVNFKRNSLQKMLSAVLAADNTPIMQTMLESYWKEIHRNPDNFSCVLEMTNKISQARIKNITYIRETPLFTPYDLIQFFLTAEKENNIVLEFPNKIEIEKNRSNLFSLFKEEKPIRKPAPNTLHMSIGEKPFNHGLLYVILHSGKIEMLDHIITNRGADLKAIFPQHKSELKLEHFYCAKIIKFICNKFREVSYLMEKMSSPESKAEEILKLIDEKKELFMLIDNSNQKPSEDENDNAPPII